MKKKKTLCPNFLSLFSDHIHPSLVFILSQMDAKRRLSIIDVSAADDSLLLPHSGLLFLSLAYITLFFFIPSQISSFTIIFTPLITTSNSFITFLLHLYIYDCYLSHSLNCLLFCHICALLYAYSLLIPPKSDIFKLYFRISLFIFCSFHI